MKKALAKAGAFFNDVCLRQMMSLPLMMLASPNDVCLRAHKSKHHIIANEKSNIIMRSITSYRRQAMHHCNRLTFVI